MNIKAGDLIDLSESSLSRHPWWGNSPYVVIRGEDGLYVLDDDNESRSIQFIIRGPGWKIVTISLENV